MKKLSEIVDALVTVIDKYGDLEIPEIYKKIDKSDDLNLGITTLKMVIDVFDDNVEDNSDYRALLPFIEKDKKHGDYMLTLYIDIKRGHIKDWVEKTKGQSAHLFEKVVDRGTYSLLTDSGKVIREFTGYVPNDLIPDKNGYGDYVTLNINKEGFITNWYENPSIDEFFDEDE
jgi:hypothetical protein